MPYRIDLSQPVAGTVDRLIDLGAVDLDLLADGTLAAIMPDSVTSDALAQAVAGADVTISPAVPRDDGSVWVLRSRPIAVGTLRILPAEAPGEANAIRLTESGAFGTGLHPTTALCLEAIEASVQARTQDAMLDVGTGSGVLALAALTLGVHRVTGIDIESEALVAAMKNARLNGLEDRLGLVRAGPEGLGGRWPLVVANVLPAPLIEMAPVLVRRVGHHGDLVLSGVPASLEREVGDTYRRLGMQRVRVTGRGGWVALLLRASW